MNTKQNLAKIIRMKNPIPVLFTVSRGAMALERNLTIKIEVTVVLRKVRANSCVLETRNEGTTLILRLK